LSGIAVQHADGGYSRRGNFGGSLVHGILMHSLDGTNVLLIAAVRSAKMIVEK